jgi:hypothetical protein
MGFMFSVKRVLTDRSRQKLANVRGRQGVRNSRQPLGRIRRENTFWILLPA